MVFLLMMLFSDWPYLRMLILIMIPKKSHYIKKCHKTLKMHLKYWSCQSSTWVASKIKSDRWQYFYYLMKFKCDGSSDLPHWNMSSDDTNDWVVALTNVNFHLKGYTANYWYGWLKFFSWIRHLSHWLWHPFGIF